VGVAEGDRIIDVAITHGNDEVVLVTREGQAIRFKEDDVRPMGRTAMGVRGVNLRDEDQVVSMAIVDSHCSLLTVCEHGYGKRTNFEEYRVQSRGGVGVINIRTTKRNGKVVGAKVVRDSDELMLITYQGMIVRIAIDGIRAIGRATQGVRIITLKPDDSLVGLARVVTDDKPEDAKLPLEEGESEPDETPEESFESEDQDE
jgi:DNA gyrase subunit A